MAKISILSKRVKLNQKWKFLFYFSCFHYYLVTLSRQIKIIKSSQQFEFSDELFVFVKIAIYQKIAKISILSKRVKLNQKWKFSLVFSCFHYYLVTLPRLIKIIKTLNNLSFPTNFSFCENYYLPKNGKNLHFVQASKTESEVEVFFGFHVFITI